MSRLVMLAALLAACGKGAAPAEDHAESEGAHAEGEHDEDAEGMVSLTPEQVVTAKIATELVQLRALAGDILATAEIEAPDDGVARIGARVGGRITKFSAGLGDHVAAGGSLATLNSPELGRAKADYIAAVTTARVAKETAAREKSLFERKISSERDWQAAEGEASKARAEQAAAEVRLHALGMSDGALARLTPEQHLGSSVAVTSPIAGVVVERPVSLGQTVAPEDTMFVVMDTSTVWMIVDLYERDLAQAPVGRAVAAQVQAWPGRTFTGTIATIGAVVDRRSRTVKARVVVANADGALKPGMFAKVALGGTSGVAREVLAVPAAAVQREGNDGYQVFLPIGDHEFQARDVELRPMGAAYFEVVTGLVAGDKVVTSGAFLLKSEASKAAFGGHEH